MGLLRLPNELIQEIAEWLWDEGDINAFLRTNCRLRDLLDPYLYSHHLHRHELGEVWENSTVLIKTAENSGPEAAYRKALEACNIRGTAKCKEIAWRAYYRAIGEGRTDLVKTQLAVDDALDPAKNPKIDQYPIIRSCAQKNDDVFYTLVNSGLYDVNSKDYNGSTALIEACARSYVDRIRFLLEQGVDVNAEEEGGDTALFRAAEANNIEVLEMLVGTGKINLNATNCAGFTALGRALYVNRKEAALFLARQPGMNPFLGDMLGHSPMLLAAMDKDKDLALLKAICESGADINHEFNEQGITALASASAEGCVDAVRYLLTQVGVKVNPSRPGVACWPLKLAASRGHDEVIKALLEHPDIDADATDTEGNTSLLAAVYLCHEKATEALLASGKPDVNKKCSRGYAVLGVAAEKEHVGLIRRLLAVPGIDPELKDDFGQTALDIAVRLRNVECAKVLLEHEAVANGSAVRAEDNPYEKVKGDGSTELEELLRPYYERRLGQS